MFYKYFFSCILLLAVAEYAVSAHSCGSGPSTKIVFGEREQYDELLFMNVEEKWGIWFVKRREEVTYPLPNVTKEGYITSIEVEEKKGNGGCVYIVEGGLDESSVKLQLESKRGHGFTFVVKIYGHRRVVD